VVVMEEEKVESEKEVPPDSSPKEEKKETKKKADAPRKRDNIGTDEVEKSEASIDLTDEYLASVHTPYPEIFSLNRMDPSIALGFYCRNRKDFIELQESLARLNPDSSAPKLVSFVDKIPNYMSSAPMDDMILDVHDDFDNVHDEASDEDDYVLL